MTTSDQINELAAALAKAQIDIGGAKKDSTNPHFKSAYADLASVRDAARPLAQHGIAIVQSCRMGITDQGIVAEVETRLVHSSGQWMADTLAVPVSKPDAQGIGSAITYGRRYTLAAFAGIAPEDDDGNAAVGRSTTQPVTQQAQRASVNAPAAFASFWHDAQTVATEGLPALEESWMKTTPAIRAYINAEKRPEWEALKTKAQKVAVPA